MRLKLLGKEGSAKARKIRIINHFIKTYDENAEFYPICQGDLWRAEGVVTAILDDRTLVLKRSRGDIITWIVESVDALVDKIIEEGYYEA
jgi:hypothetical protein